MEVWFTPEQEKRLAQIADREGTDAAHLVQGAALALLEEDARFLRGVERGIEAAERGDFIEEEEMDERVQRMFRS